MADIVKIFSSNLEFPYVEVPGTPGEITALNFRWRATDILDNVVDTDEITLYCMPGSKMRVENFSELVNEYHKKNGYMPIKVTVEVLELNLNTLIWREYLSFYCSRRINVSDVAEFWKHNFMTSMKTKVVSGKYRHFACWEGYYNEAQENVNVNYDIAYRLPQSDDPEKIWIYSNYKGYRSMTRGEMNINHIHFSVQDVEQMMKLDMISGVELLSVTMSTPVTDVSIEYLIDKLNERTGFLFRNCFGVLELMELPGVMTSEAERDAKIGYMGTVKRDYDISAEREYTFTTGPLTGAEMQWADQLLDSPEVYIYTQDVDYSPGWKLEDNLAKLPKLIITDMEHSTHDANDGSTINTIKLSFKMERESVMGEFANQERIHNGILKINFN